MKRIVVLTVVLLAVFSLGFGIGQSQYFIHDEMPSPQALSETASLRQTEQRALRREKLKQTLAFLDAQVTMGWVNYKKNPSSTLQAQIDALVNKRQRIYEELISTTFGDR